jgi:hypothetical protein
MASCFAQACLDKCLRHEPGADQALLGSSFEYLEPVGYGVSRPITINRDAYLSFYFSSGYDVHLADGAVAKDLDIVHDGCS